MMEKVNLIGRSHFLVELENEDTRYYASCNFGFYPEFDGLEFDGSIFCYLLHPKKGSRNFILEYDADIELYYLAPDQPEVDSDIIDEINEAIKKNINSTK